MSVLVPGARETITVGNKIFTNLSSLIVLHCYVAASNYGTFRKGRASSGYTPSGSTSFYLHALKFQGFAAANFGAYLVQSDNDCGINTATAPTNAVNINGMAIPYCHTGAGPFTEVAFDKTNFYIANAKYLSLYGNASAMLAIVYGYEV